MLNSEPVLCSSSDRWPVLALSAVSLLVFTAGVPFIATFFTMPVAWRTCRAQRESSGRDTWSKGTAWMGSAGECMVRCRWSGLSCADFAGKYSATALKDRPFSVFVLLFEEEKSALWIPVIFLRRIALVALLSFNLSFAVVVRNECLKDA